MPSSSRALRRSERVRGLIPSSERSSSQNRSDESAKSRMIRRVHLPETTSAVRHTGHSRSITSQDSAKALLCEALSGPGALEFDLVDLDSVGHAVYRVDHVLALAGGDREQGTVGWAGDAGPRTGELIDGLRDREVRPLLVQSATQIDHHRGDLIGKRGEGLDVPVALQGLARLSHRDVGNDAVEVQATGHRGPRARPRAGPGAPR